MAKLPGEQQPLNSPILLVEDDHAIRLLITTVLKKAGYDVTQANDGREALARIAEAPPDLIISDVMMPHLDGFGLLTQLRADPSTRTIPLILLTARRTKDDIVSGLDLGADDYLVKPFDKDELLARVRAKIARPPVPVDMLPLDRTTGVLTARHFQQETAREFARAERGGASGVLVYIDLDELPRLRERLGARSEAQIAKQMAGLIGADLQPLDLVSRDHDGRFALLLPETDSATAQRRLVVLARRIATHVFAAGGEQLRLTPTIGFTTFDTATSVNLLHTQALIALDTAAMHLDLQPMRYNPSQDTALARRKPAIQATMWARFRAWSRLPAQLVLLGLIALVLPFALYTVLAANGLDITPIAYIIVVLALLITAYLILVEGFKALRRIDPPEEPGATYPPASAIIAAYLPNEAATVVETIEAFLRLTYPGQLQVILAYNTPRDLPMELVLRELARRDQRFVPLRVAGSTSKAQNVNAARNGDESWVARMIAVEFEAIYAASHPGRARLHNFGIFGGSNGYWKTDLLRQTRMHGFMLTEDIDSSIRIIEAGHKIASDPYLISRELATTTLKALWNQRMRWAQGWFQVSLRHIWRGLRSQRLSFRQKLGFVHLLAWREIYPWLSFQMVPIIAFWAWRLGGPDRIDWFVPIFVLTTLFTQSAAIGQTLFAYRLAAPEIRRRRRWFVFYLLASFLFYTPFKNLIAMVAQIKEALGERQWKVTPRGNVGQDAS